MREKLVLKFAPLETVPEDFFAEAALWYFAGGRGNHSDFGMFQCSFSPLVSGDGIPGNSASYCLEFLVRG